MTFNGRFIELLELEAWLGKRIGEATLKGAGASACRSFSSSLFLQLGSPVLEGVNKASQNGVLGGKRRVASRKLRELACEWTGDVDAACTSPLQNPYALILTLNESRIGEGCFQIRPDWQPSRNSLAAHPHGWEELGGTWA